LAALLQGGHLCEATASPDEALDAFKQAKKLVSSRSADVRQRPLSGRAFASGPGLTHN
jgi:hypothetical protein